MRAALAFLFGAILPLAVLADGLQARPDRETGLYSCGETATFLITVPQGEKEIRWKLDNFGTNVFAEGSTPVSLDGTVRVRGTSPRPGFLRLTACSVSNKVIASAGFDVGQIRQSARRPDDFDAYWKGEFARLKREVPLDPTCEYDAELSKDKPYETYRLSFATFGGKRLWGFMTIPRDRSQAPFGGRIRICDAGTGATDAWEGSTREVTVTMNVHYFKPGRTRDEQIRLIDETSASLAAKYGLKPGTYYANAGVSESREDYYFHDSMVGLARVVDWLAERPEVDPNRLMYFGCSQGGGFGLATVFMNPRYRRVCFSVPAITGHFGLEDGWENGWPGLIANQPEALRDVARRNAAYFDGVNFAAGISLPVRFLVGFSDTCCPPPNVYAAFNACPSKDKAIVNCLGAGHCGWRKWLDANRNAPTWLDPDAWLRTSASRQDAVDAAYSFYLDEPNRVWTDDAAFVSAVYGADFVNDPPSETLVFEHRNTGDLARDRIAMNALRDRLEPGDVIVSVLSNGVTYARFVCGDVYGTRHCRILGPIVGDGRLWESDAGSQLFNPREVGGYCLAGGTRGTISFRLIRPIRSPRVKIAARRRHPTGMRTVDADPRVNALAEAAYAYYLKGTLAQYDSVPLVDDKEMFYRWSRKFHKTPIEEATSDKTYYAVCSAFVQGVYWDALGLDYDYPEPVTFNFMELSPKETIVFSFDRDAGKMSVDAAIAEVRSLIRPGDIITGSNYPKGSGHVMLCYGFVDGRLKLIHASGDKFDMSTGVDRIESEGTVYFDDLEPALFVRGHYVDLAHYRRFALIRPLVDPSVRLTPTAAARLRYPSLRFDRRVTGGVHGSVIAGDKLVYETVLENHSKCAYELEVVEGDARENVVLAPGSVRRLTHAVRPKGAVGTYYSQIARAGGIPAPRLETQIVSCRWSVEEAFAWAETNLTDRTSAPGNRVRTWFGGRACQEGDPATRLRETRSRDLMPGDVVLSFDATGVRRIWVKDRASLVEKVDGQIRPVDESRVTALLAQPFFAAYRAN